MQVLQRCLVGLGVTVRARLGYVLPMVYFIWSIFKQGRRRRPPIRKGAEGLEWETHSPPPTENFVGTPIVTHGALNAPPEGGRHCQGQKDADES